MSEQNFKQYLGWGLVGTPAGRQYSSGGIDKQLNLGKTAFELQQELGGCLSSPKSGDAAPLCALICREVNGNTILGFATYYSIYEQGQTRAGTYFGSFIESVNSVFTADTLSSVFEVLSDLNRYQVVNFIDWERKSYKTNNIANVSFDEPKALDLIQLYSLPVNDIQYAEREDFLFIHCKAGESEKVAEELLQSALYYQYRNIFFSESEHISQQIKQTKRYQITSQELFSRERIVLPYKVEIGHLHSAIQKLQTQSQNCQNEIARLNAEQDKIVEAKVKEKEREYQIELEIVEKEKNKAQEESQKMLELAGLGKTELSKFTENTAKIAAEIANKKFSITVDAKLSSLNEKMDQIQAKADWVMSRKNRQSSLITWIMSSISAILFFIILGMLVSNRLSSDKVISETEYKQLSESKKKLDEKQKELDIFLNEKKVYESKIQELNNQLQKTKEYSDSLCKQDKKRGECK